MEQATEWKEIKSNTNFKHLNKVGEQVEGVLVDRSKGKYGMVYHLDVNGERQVMFGNAILDDKMRDVVIGSQVRIKLESLIPTDKGNPAKNYGVWVK